jgi:uncharacterized membrane protein
MTMSNQNLTLYAASYPDADSAKQDFDTLKGALGNDFAIAGAVVLSCDREGKVDVVEKNDGHVAGGALVGGGIGLVVGLFAPALLTATAVGAGIGAVLGHLGKKVEQKALGFSLEDIMPPDTSAVIVVVDNIYLDRVEAALANAGKKVDKAIDSGDVDKLRKALATSTD